LNVQLVGDFHQRERDEVNFLRGHNASAADRVSDDINAFRRKSITVDNDIFRL
jgi:hypothetical protein